MKCQGMPAVGDRGQRFEVRFIDETGEEKVLGWCEAFPGRLVDVIEKHPIWHTPRVIDRLPHGTAKCKCRESYGGHLKIEDFCPVHGRGDPRVLL